MVAHVIMALLILASSHLMFIKDSHAATGKLGHLYPQDALIAQFIIQFADRVQKSSGGQLTITVYPDAQLGNAIDLLNKLRKGDVELALIPAVMLSTVVEEYQLFKLPYLFRTYDQVDEMLDGQYGRSLLSTTQKANLVALGLFDQGFVDFTGSRAIRAPSDLKGLRVVVPSDQIQAATLQALGATPISPPFSELYTALQQGVVDGAEVPLQTSYQMRLHESKRYVSLTKAYYRPDILVANASWHTNVLDPQSRKALENQVEQIVKMYRQVRRTQEQDTIKSLTAQNVNLVRDVDAKAFEDIIWPTYGKEPIASVAKSLIKCPPGCPLPPICCSKSKP